jgi:hypothetical protein
MSYQTEELPFEFFKFTKRHGANGTTVQSGLEFYDTECHHIDPDEEAAIRHVYKMIGRLLVEL